MLLALIAGSYFAIQNSKVQTFIISKITKQLSYKLNAQVHIGKVEIAFFNKVILNDVIIEDQQKDTLWYSELITAQIDSFKIKERRISLSEISIENSNIKIKHDSVFNFSFILDSIPTKNIDSTIYWNINCSQFEFHGANISYKNKNQENVSNIFVKDLNFFVSDFDYLKDSIYFKINSLDFNDGKNLYLNQLAANVAFTKNEIEFNQLNFETRHSQINNSSFVVFLKEKPEIDFNLKNSEVSFFELAELIPSLRGMDQSINISGHIYGDLDDLKGKDIVLKSGKATRAILDFYINDITNPEEMYLFLDLKQLQTTFADISDFQLPKTLPIDKIDFPESFYDAGLLKFNGNFSGFINDFVTFGTLSSDMGTIETDVSLKPEGNGLLRYRGNLSTTNFMLGEFLKDTVVGNVTFKGIVDGNFDKINDAVSLFFKGDINEVELNKYVYRNIDIEGLFMDRMFDGLMSINDPNLKFAFSGRIDLNNELPVFDFDLKLENALPGNLNLSATFPKAEMAFEMKANFEGNEIDNLNGSIVFKNGRYSNRNGQLDFEEMVLKSTTQDSTKTLTFESDYLDIVADGQYHFQSILNALKKDVQKFIPAIKYKIQENEKPNVFEYRINIHTLDEFTQVFAPDLKFETPFLLYGSVDSEKQDFQLAGSIPGFIYKNYLVQNVFLNNKTINNKYSSKLRFGEVQTKKGYKIYDFTVESVAANNRLENKIHWFNNADSTANSIVKTNSVFTRTAGAEFPTIQVEGLASEIYVADSSWQLHPFTAELTNDSISIQKFNITHGNQSLLVDGNISKTTQDFLLTEFKNLNLAHLDQYLNTNINLDGILNGSIGVTGIYKHPIITSNATINNLQYQNNTIGNVFMASNWDHENEVINSELTIDKDKFRTLDINGYYKPSTEEVNYDLNASGLSLELLGTVIRQTLSDFHGKGTGNIKIGGTYDNLTMDGVIMAANAGVTVDYTKVHYTLNDNIYFKKNRIEFDDITFYDERNNIGVFYGTLTHRNFQDMIYDITINSPKILALKTTPVDNEQFYGDVFVNGKISIQGQGKSVSLVGAATTLSETNINISMEYENDVEQYDFIKFVPKEKTETEKFFFAKEEKAEFEMSLTVEVTPDAKVQLVYNSQIGDIIKAQGEGILLFEMDKDYNISLSGDYTVVQGDYLFTLQNVLNKKFTIEQGGSMVWTGDPYNAIINLTAIYSLKASLYDLMMGTYLYQDPDKDVYQRIPVECKILLSEELTNPLINFEIEFPEEDEALIGILQQFINTEEEMNKQILSLIVLGKFYTPEYLRGQAPTQAANTLGTTASEMFSNQLSNWLSQISNDVDIGLNYRPGNQITNDEIELAMSTQIFNNRVTLNGNIGNNVYYESSGGNNSNSSQIVGDFDIKVKLVPSGKIQFKAFNRSNNNLVYETAPYTQGIGLSFKEEYNSFNELLKKIGSIFRKEK